MKARYVNVYKLMEFANNMKDKTIDANDIARFPWADVRENVHAHWEYWSYLGFDAYRYWFRRCSNCFWEREDDNEEKDTPFCPNCGAVMDERSENEETN